VVVQAPEPSEILWHNRHVTTRAANCHKLVVFVICVIFLLGMFLFFTWMKSKAIKNMFRYPSTTNCDSVDTIFTNSEGVIDLAYYKEYAGVDSSLTQERQGTGIYQCYCKYYVDVVDATESDNLCHVWFR
jgi:hypothetical protein